MPDRLAELEKVILDYYLAKGYEVGVDIWQFNVNISAEYKRKNLVISFFENNKWEIVIEIKDKNTKEMFDKAIEYFSIRQNEVQKCQ